MSQDHGYWFCFKLNMLFQNHARSCSHSKSTHWQSHRELVALTNVRGLNCSIHSAHQFPRPTSPLATFSLETEIYSSSIITPSNFPTNLFYFLSFSKRCMCFCSSFICHLATTESGPFNCFFSTRSWISGFPPSFINSVSCWFLSFWFLIFRRLILVYYRPQITRYYLEGFQCSQWDIATTLLWHLSHAPRSRTIRYCQKLISTNWPSHKHDRPTD